jgi:hypothetical protein
MAEQEPRAYTQDEAREKLLGHMRTLVSYWARQPGSDTDKINGFASSVLNIFDGTSAEMPALDIVVRPHPDDKDYRISLGENYYEYGQCINGGVHMHEEWCQF